MSNPTAEEFLQSIDWCVGMMAPYAKYLDQQHTETLKRIDSEMDAIRKDITNKHANP